MSGLLYNTIRNNSIGHWFRREDEVNMGLSYYFKDPTVQEHQSCSGKRGSFFYTVRVSLLSFATVVLELKQHKDQSLEFMFKVSEKSM